MSSKFALFVLHFFLFLFPNWVATANTFDSDCQEICKIHRPAGTSAAYVLECDTFSDWKDKFFCSASCGSFCPKKICDKETKVEGAVKLNCPDPNSHFDSDSDSADFPNFKIIGIVAGCVVGVVLICSCICGIVFLSRGRRRRARGMQGAPMQAPPPMMGYAGVGYAGGGYAYGAGSFYPPSSSGASTDSTVQPAQMPSQSPVS